MTKRSILLSLVLSLCLAVLLPSSAANPPLWSETTRVTQAVSTCWGWGSCCVSGNMRATFQVTLNGDGTANVRATLRAMGVNGDCGGVHGQVAVVSLARVGHPWGFSGSFTSSAPNTYATGSTSGTVNADGSVTNVVIGLVVGSVDPG